VKSCGTCKHWTEPRPVDRRDGFNLCGAIGLPGPERWMDEGDAQTLRGRVADGTASQWDRTRLEAWDNRTQFLAYTQDGSDYQADLFTHADFGCILHEETP
jgi:hypothetical protein